MVAAYVITERPGDGVLRAINNYDFEFFIFTADCVKQLLLLIL